jgi:hypothetical protein
MGDGSGRWGGEWKILHRHVDAMMEKLEAAQLLSQ